MDLFETAMTEQDVFEILLPSLKDGLKHSNAGPDNVILEARKQYAACCYTKADPYNSTVPAVSTLAFRICCRADKHYFGVSRAYLRDIPAAISARVIPARSSDGFANFDFTPTPSGVLEYADFLAGVLDNLTYSLPSEFDCCSRFSECSDAMQCIHPVPAVATSCSYRKVLRSGRVYYGDNRNI